LGGCLTYLEMIKLLERDRHKQSYRMDWPNSTDDWIVNLK